MTDTATTATSAIDYGGRGWSVIRVKGKIPAEPWAEYQQRRMTQEKIEAKPWPGVGIVTGAISNLVVLDADSPEAVEELKRRGHPPTPMVKTARGLHAYFRHPGGELPTRIGLGSGLDLKGDGGYVVAPPSKHPSGKVYEWIISPEDEDPAELPPWAAEQLTASRTDDHRELIDIGAVLGGVPQGERDKTLFRTSAKLRGAGVPYAFTRKLILEAAANCKPPFPEQLAIAKVDGAYDRYKPNQNGHSRSHSLGRDGMGNDPVGTIRAVSFRGREKPGPREWIVDHAVCKGHPASWYGESGIAKSLLAAHMGLHIAGDGIDYWAGLRVQTVPVIYGDFELDEIEHLRRSQELAAGMGLPDVPTKFHYLPLAGLPANEAFMIAAEESARLKAGLFIVDSVGFALDGDSELAKDVLRFYRECVQPIRDAGATPFLIDHQAKVIKGEKYSDKQEFGSVYKTNAVRSSFQIRGAWDGNELTATFTHKKTNFGPKVADFSLRLVFGDDRVQVTRLAEAVPNPDKELSKKEQVLHAIVEMGRATAETAAQKTGLNLKTVQNAISEYLAEGMLVDTGKKGGRSRIVIPHSHTTQGTGTGMKAPADTSGDEERIDQLVREGMSPKLAREAVLGKAWVRP